MSDRHHDDRRHGWGRGRGGYPFYNPYFGYPYVGYNPYFGYNPYVVGLYGGYGNMYMGNILTNAYALSRLSLLPGYPRY
jgi:hypothetical protein